MPEKKESTPTVPELSIPKPVRAKPTYEYAGAEKTSQSLGEAIPKQLVPTKRMATIIGLIFGLVIILALVQFPFGKMLAGDINIVIGIGYPLPFLELGLTDVEESPLRILNLLIDILIYLVLAYAIDIIINLVTMSNILKTKEEPKPQVSVYKNIKPTLADKIVKKAFGEEKK